MTQDKSCPGSRTIRNPVPENFPCPQCGRQVEIWTDEAKASCPDCKSVVFRERKMSCIDWCPHARECVGPEVYERLKPGAKEDLSGTPLDVIKREHDRTLDTISLLRGVSLCLKFGSLGTESPLHDRGLVHQGKVMDYFDKDVMLHFRREEEILFPALAKHLAGKVNPAELLLGEHDEWRQAYRQLKEAFARLQAKGPGNNEAFSVEVQELNSRVEQLLREHIRKENESLLPLARSLLSEAELAEISQKWHLLNN